MDGAAATQNRPRRFAPRRLLQALGDERLVEHVRRGNDVAFEVLYDRHHRGLLSFCRHMLGTREEAEDALQQTFFSAYRDLQKDQREIKVQAWLYTIARNRCLSVLRARREKASDDIDLSTAGLSEEVEQRADLRELLADMAELPEQQRAALVLSELGDLSHQEVASVVGVDTPKVKSLVFQARTALLESRDAREVSHEDIREQLSIPGATRRKEVKRHLAACPSCSEYWEQVRRQRALLGVILPVIPTIALREGVLAAVGVGGTGAGAVGATAVAGGAGGYTAAAGSTGAAGAAATAGGGAVAGSTAAAGGAAAVGSLGAAKIAAVAIIATGAAAGGGAVVVNQGDSDSKSGSSTSAQSSRSGSGGKASGGSGAEVDRDRRGDRSRSRADRRREKAAERRSARRRARRAPASSASPAAPTTAFASPPAQASSSPRRSSPPPQAQARGNGGSAPPPGNSGGGSEPPPPEPGPPPARDNAPRECPPPVNVAPDASITPQPC